MKTITVDGKIYEACEDCGKKSIWTYMPGDYGFCDNHVPRGCSCNSHPIDSNWDNLDPKNWKEETDEQGRLLPCCEFWYKEEGWKINE